MNYEVTARLTIEADSAAEAVELFDAEYRDPYNVVHFHATRPGELTTCGERRNDRTTVLPSGRS